MMKSIVAAVLLLVAGSAFAIQQVPKLKPVPKVAFAIQKVPQIPFPVPIAIC